MSIAGSYSTADPFAQTTATTQYDLETNPSPPETEECFRDLLATYRGDNDNHALESWIRSRVETDFSALKKRPSWIQSVEWPFDDNLNPMIFVGQIDIVVQSDNIAAQYLHDDTSYYVFMARGTGALTVVVQQF